MFTRPVQVQESKPAAAPTKPVARPVPPPRPFEMTRRRWIILGAVIALLLLGVAAAARPIYHAYNRWRSRSEAAQGELLYQKENWAAAFQKAENAYRANAGNVRALRLMARLESKGGQEQALTFWQALIANPASTMADRQEYIRTGLQMGRPDVIAPELEAALKLAPADPRNLSLAAEFFYQKDNRIQALDYARRAAAGAPQDKELQLNYGRLLIASPGKADHEEAAKLLWPLTTGTDQTSLDALLLLVLNRDLSKEDALKLAQLIPQHPLARDEQRLVAVELQMRFSPEDADRLAKEVFEKYVHAPPEKKLIPARWFNHLGRFRETADLVDAATAVTRQDLFLTYVDALAPLGRWDEVDRLLKDEKAPLDNAMRELYRARVAKETGHDAEATSHWIKVQIAAADKPESLWFVGHYAERIGQTEDTVKAYRRLAHIPGYEKAGYTALVRVFNAAGDTTALRDVMKRMVLDLPDESAPRNDLAYLDLLLDENVTASTRIARSLLEKDPNVLAYRTTLALGYLRSDQADAAAKLYEAVSIDWSKAMPHWRAVYAAALSLNGREPEAKEIAAKIPQEGLKPEEKALIKKLL